MVQFNGPHGKITATYLRHGGCNPPAEPSKDFVGKIVLVTGCTSGIGYQAALKIAALNPKKLILGTRTVAKGEAAKSQILAQLPSLDSSVIEVFAIDYTSFTSVSQFAETVKQSTQTLDCALLSAGVALQNRETVDDVWDTSLKVNVLSAALLAVELLPLLKATPSSVLEFVNSVSYCTVTSADVAALLEEPSASTLKFFNNPERWTTQRGYYESKLLLMFVVQGLVKSLGGSQGKLGSPKDPLVLACCPGQCKTNLYRNFPLSVRVFMILFNAVVARSAEEGSRTLVTGLMQDEESNGRMWMNDRFDDRSPGLTEQEWNSLQKRVWREILDVLREHKPGLEIRINEKH